MATLTLPKRDQAARAKRTLRGTGVSHRYFPNTRVLPRYLECFDYKKDVSVLGHLVETEFGIAPKTIQLVVNHAQCSLQDKRDT